MEEGYGAVVLIFKEKRRIKKTEVACRAIIAV